MGEVGCGSHRVTDSVNGSGRGHTSSEPRVWILSREYMHYHYLKMQLLQIFFGEKLMASLLPTQLTIAMQKSCTGKGIFTRYHLELKSGKSFVIELSPLFHAFGEGAAMEGVALKLQWFYLLFCSKSLNKAKITPSIWNTE